MRRSTRPCTTSKPEVTPQNKAAARRMFPAPTSLLALSSTTSDTSNILIGRAASLLLPSVFSRPGTRLVRTHSKSHVLAFAMRAALLTSRGRLTSSKLSLLDPRIHVSTSVNPAMAISARIRSEKQFTGSCLPTVTVLGSVLGRLLYPKAMATSSMMSHGWSTSLLVAGTLTLSLLPPSVTVVSRHILVSSLAACSASKCTPTRALM
mmetsp:Transcript_33370/g.56012  ORF Transcript_33370/g.56012 Transcript_33370/m.56012 type:complete len:207 (+) Transcript_33370:1389-2009(+)